MRVFITGVNGFLGKRLARELSQAGMEVIGLSKNFVSVPVPYTVIVGDVLKPLTFSSIVSDVDCVIHLAAITAHNEIVRDEQKATEVTLEGTKNVLDSFLNSKTAKLFIYSSTGKVYGKIQELPITEKHPLNPLNILGRIKYKTEKLIEGYANNPKSFVILRIFNVYGEDQRENFLIPTIINQLKLSLDLTLGDVNVQRDFIFVDDVINLMTTIVASRKVALGISKYNVCSGKPISPVDIIKQIEMITGKKIKINIDKSRFRLDEYDVEYGDYHRAKEVFGWDPKVELNEGLKRVLVANGLL